MPAAIPSGARWAGLVLSGVPEEPPASGCCGCTLPTTPKPPSRSFHSDHDTGGTSDHWLVMPALTWGSPAGTGALSSTPLRPGCPVVPVGVDNRPEEQRKRTGADTQ